jgi:hypothetical protein
MEFILLLLFAIQLRVAGAIDLAHPPGAELVENSVMRDR